MSTLRELGPHSVATNFVPGRLRLARLARGWTLRELAERIETTSSAVGQFEKGTARPSSRTLSRLTMVFRVPPSFFALPEPPAVDLNRCHFRRRRSTTKTERIRVLAKGALQLDLAEYLTRHVNFPDEQLSPLKVEATAGLDLEEFARSLRGVWGLGRGPIANMAHVMESRGAFIVTVQEHSKRLDAFSSWVDQRPVVFITAEKAPSRRRWDLAHELGHLLMHPVALAGDHSHEKQADTFAGAFLLPRDPFERECPKRLVWPHLIELKKRWGVSLAAMVKRAYHLGIYSEATYRRAFVRLSQLGWREQEPMEPAPEKPIVLQKALQLLRGSGHSMEQLAAEIGRHLVEIEQLTAGEPDELALFG